MGEVDGGGGGGGGGGGVGCWKNENILKSPILFSHQDSCGNPFLIVMIGDFNAKSKD